jgi:hypothetical protein
MTTDIQEQANGRLKGRGVPALPQFTFPDSGIAVGLRRLAPDTQDQITRALMRETPAPPIPVVETELGEEPNPADPDYQQALSIYMQHIGMEASTKMFELAMRRIEVEVDQAAVDRYKEDMAAIGIALDPDLDDRAIYIRCICISSTIDLAAMLAYLQRRSMPTEVAVQEYLDSFQRHVQGA